MASEESARPHPKAEDGGRGGTDHSGGAPRAAGENSRQGVAAQAGHARGLGHSRVRGDDEAAASRAREGELRAL